MNGVGNQREKGIYSLVMEFMGVGDGKEKVGGFGHSG